MLKFDSQRIEDNRKRCLNAISGRTLCLLFIALFAWPANCQGK